MVVFASALVLLDVQIQIFPKTTVKIVCVDDWCGENEARRSSLEAKDTKNYTSLSLGSWDSLGSGHLLRLYSVASELGGCLGNRSSISICYRI